MKVLLTFLHLSLPNLIENDYNFVFFDYKVWTQQHFESRLFWKNAEKLRKHAQLKSYVETWLTKNFVLAIFFCIDREYILFLFFHPFESERWTIFALNWCEVRLKRPILLVSKLCNIPCQNFFCLLRLIVSMCLF